MTRWLHFVRYRYGDFRRGVEGPSQFLRHSFLVSFGGQPWGHTHVSTQPPN